jgi:hypothetical protein
LGLLEEAGLVALDLREERAAFFDDQAGVLALAVERGGGGRNSKF